MAHTHEYDCIVCGAHFDSQQDLSRHNNQQHLKNASGMERPREDATNDALARDREQGELGRS